MTSLIKGRPIPRHADSRIATHELESPDENESPTESGFLSESVASYATSVFVHSLLLLFLALFVYAPNHNPEFPTELIEAEFEPLPEPESIAPSETVLKNLFQVGENTDSSQLQTDARQLANASDPPPVQPAFLSNKGLFPPKQPSHGSGWGGDALAGLGESAGMSLVAGNGDQKKAEGEVGFFGTKAKGRSFVFIVDCSGSMTQPTPQLHPRENLPVTRFERARQELYQSLAQLTRGQTFYIFFYNHGTYPHFFPTPAPSLVAANPEMLGLTRNWIQKIVPGGGTDPRTAFQLGLSLRPDVIFFLTDGIIPPVTRMVAKQNNKSRTRIHTIAFGTKDLEGILQGIAADNNGQFRSVE
ncbi:MAG: hypothetical protein KDA84_06375 [Planctomycetaceae bacterium]|nr:hypothetical protein [Planctomycetaceae bacterium]